MSILYNIKAKSLLQLSSKYPCVCKWSKLLLNGAEMLILTESKLKWKLAEISLQIKETFPNYIRKLLTTKNEKIFIFQLKISCDSITDILFHKINILLYCHD